ncbi:hypothetical protein KI387_018157 [Taxus chinensis]|uniref:Uncharacterized protein n=1 Tax=Taxus chinensis TaxID=29808 RepID=A0AA38GKW4_TAXCH|nr:hypothetical protein KI387_018157 [Taxus chinensis]
MMDKFIFCRWPKLFSTLADNNNLIDGNLQNPFAHFAESIFNISSADIAQMFRVAPSLETLETLEKVEEFVDMLNNHRCQHHQIAKIMRSVPKLIVSSAENELEPKIQLFEDFGIKGEYLAKILTSRPRILGASLEQELLPKMTLLKNVCQSRDLLIKVLVRNPSILTYNLEKTLKPSLAFWEGFGFRGKELAKFIAAKPDVLRYSSLTPAQLDLIHNIDIDESSAMYKYVLITVATYRTETLHVKMHNLQLCGLSSEETWELFRVFPKVLALSEEKVRQNMDFIVNDMGLLANCVLKYPQLLIANLERVLKPRYVVWQRMKSMNVLGHFEFKSLDSVMIMPEAKFLSKIVRGRPMLYSIYEDVMADFSRSIETSSDV